ncbi:hypothetical protein V6Z11_D07G092800 [Gossypium hirsutum]
MRTLSSCYELNKCMCEPLPCIVQTSSIVQDNEEGSSLVIHCTNFLSTVCAPSL